MGKTKEIYIPKQVNINNKLIYFIIFFGILSIIIFNSSNSIFHFDSGIKKANDLYVDGSNLKPIADIGIGSINIFLLFFKVVGTFIINIIITLISTVIFNKIYFRTICLEKEMLEKNIKNIIWGVSIFGIILIIGLNMNIQYFINILLITLIVYLPLPIIVHTYTFSKMNKLYDTLNKK